MYALHLRRYNDALFIHDTVRAWDALDMLQDFYDRERTTKTQMVRAERWLLELFDGEAQQTGFELLESLRSFVAGWLPGPREGPGSLFS